MRKYEHGGNIYDNKIKYDFSANINPFGMPENVKEALKDNIGMFEKYPDIHCTELRNSLAKKYNVLSENIVCGNGAIDVLYKCVSVIKRMKQEKFEEKYKKKDGGQYEKQCTERYEGQSQEQVRQRRVCLLAVPCFSEYEKALLENDFEVKYYFRQEENDYRLGEDYIEYMNDIDMLILCQPNNPTGDLIGGKLLEKILKKADREDIFVILDECFMDFVPVKNADNMVKLRNNVLIMNAFTKIYAMAGLRLGFALSGNAELIEKISEYGAEWNVSVPAQIAGVEALKDDEYPEETRHYVEKERNYLVRELTSMGIKVYPSHANFILIYGSEKCYEFLLCKGIMLRDCSNFAGLKKGYYRIAIRTHEENEKLIDTLKLYF